MSLVQAAEGLVRTAIGAPTLLLLIWLHGYACALRLGIDLLTLTSSCLGSQLQRVRFYQLALMPPHPLSTLNIPLKLTGEMIPLELFQKDSTFSLLRLGLILNVNRSSTQPTIPAVHWCVDRQVSSQTHPVIPRY